MKFLVVIPHYGPDEELIRCMKSFGVDEQFLKIPEAAIFAAPFKYGELYIVNNNKENFGFTKACNMGLSSGIIRDFDVMVLFNNDAEVEDLDDFFAQITREFTDEIDTGIVGVRIVKRDDPDYIHHGGTGACFPAGVHKMGRVSSGDWSKRSRERWVTGACMAVVADCIISTGLMDEKFVNYGSDSDYCYRARLHGWDVVYLPTTVIHKTGQSANPDPAQAKRLRLDMLHFQDKWISGKTFVDLDNELVE